MPFMPDIELPKKRMSVDLLGNTNLLQVPNFNDNFKLNSLSSSHSLRSHSGSWFSDVLHSELMEIEELGENYCED